MRIKQNMILIFVLLMATVLRFYGLGSNPPHLTPDEAALGYNAYSILKTAKDEYGQFMPVIFKSFGDYKPGLYIYASVVPISIFGLTEFGVRFAGAASGVLGVFLVYKVTLELLKLGKTKKYRSITKIPLIAAFLLSINPWHIHFSRGAWEANLSLTLTLVAVLFFLKAMKREMFLIPSALFFALTLWTYQGAKLSSLIVILIVSLIFIKSVIKLNLRVLAVSLITGIVISLPILLSFVNGQTGRLSTFSIFNSKRSQSYLQEQLDHANVEAGSSIYYFFYSETLITFRGIIGRWFNHFSSRFLLFEGDWQNPRHASPDHGQLLIFDLVLIISGLYALSLLRDAKIKKLILIWLLLAPLPAVLSRDGVHAIRSLNMIIPLTLLSAFGVDKLHKLIKRSKFRYVYYTIFGSLFVLSFIRYLDSYWVHQPVHNLRYWDYGYKQLVEKITPIQANYEKVNIQFTYAQPYIYFLFYQKKDPSDYQKLANIKDDDTGDVGRVTGVDNIFFDYINWSERRGDFGQLFVAGNQEMPIKDSSDPLEFKFLGEVSYPDGEMIFRIVEVLDEENINKHKIFE